LVPLFHIFADLGANPGAETDSRFGMVSSNKRDRKCDLRKQISHFLLYGEFFLGVSTPNIEAIFSSETSIEDLEGFVP
jgi:hypothetical protein